MCNPHPLLLRSLMDHSCPNRDAFSLENSRDALSRSVRQAEREPGEEFALNPPQPPPPPSLFNGSLIQCDDLLLLPPLPSSSFFSSCLENLVLIAPSLPLYSPPPTLLCSLIANRYALEPHDDGLQPDAPNAARHGPARRRWGRTGFGRTDAWGQDGRELASSSGRGSGRRQEGQEGVREEGERERDGRVLMPFFFPARRRGSAESEGGVARKGSMVSLLPTFLLLTIATSADSIVLPGRNRLSSSRRTRERGSVDAPLK